jgi:hypothetical protein
VSAFVVYRLRPPGRVTLTPIVVLLSSAAVFYPQLFVTGFDHDVRFSYWANVSCTLALYLSLAALSAAVPRSRRG